MRAIKASIDGVSADTNARNDGAGESMCPRITSAGVPGKGNQPVNTSYAVTPNACWLVAAVTRSPARCSGLM